MKIIFDKDLKNRKIKKGKEYVVLTNVNGPQSYTILNDDKYPVILFVNDKKSTILDSESIFHAPITPEFSVTEIESEIPPLLLNLFQSDNEYFLNDLLENRCWAITEFTRKLVSVGIEVSEEFRQIAFYDTSKIFYVQAEMSALFLAVCNFFAECANMLFHFRFDKHNRDNIDLLTLANISYNRYHQTAKDVTYLNEIENWKLDLEENLYSYLTMKSDFGEYIQKNSLQEDSEHERACLRQSTHRIILAIESIFIEEEVKVCKLPLKELNVSWDQYCLIFENSEYYYRFYLGNYD